MDHIRGENRNHPLLHSLEELVAADSFARIIDAYVDAIDLASYEFSYYELNEAGRPPYHPSSLLKLYLYGYQHGIRSCRKLEKACTVNIEVMWLLGQLQPCYKTITIDSFKIRAQNSLKNNYNAAKIERQQKYLDRKIVEYESALEEAEDEESAEILWEKIQDKQEKQQKYERLSEALKQSHDGQISTTDADARAVVFQRNSVQVGHNIQAASDAKHKLLIAMDSGDVNDTKALSSMIRQVQGNISKERFRVLADKGYHNGRELKASEELGVKTYVSPKGSSSSKAKTSYAVDKFVYHKRTDSYVCPAGQA